MIQAYVVAIKVKGKAYPVCDTKEYEGSRCLSPLILNLGARWSWVVNLDLRPLSPL